MPVKLCVTLPLREAEGLRVALVHTLGERVVVGQREGLVLTVKVPESVFRAVGERLPVGQCDRVPLRLDVTEWEGVMEELGVLEPKSEDVAQGEGLWEVVEEPLLQALRLAVKVVVGDRLGDTLMLEVFEPVGEPDGDGETLGDKLLVGQALGKSEALQALEALPARVALGESVVAQVRVSAEVLEALGQLEAVGKAPVGEELCDSVGDDVPLWEEDRQSERVRD